MMQQIGRLAEKFEYLRIEIGIFDEYLRF